MLVAGNRIREEKKGRGTRAHIGPHEVELQSEARLGMPFCLVFTLDLQDRRWGQDEAWTLEIEFGLGRAGQTGWQEGATLSLCSGFCDIRGMVHPRLLPPG